MGFGYAILLVITVFFPLSYTLIHRKYMRQQGYKLFLGTVLLAAVPFLLIDVIAVSAGWWRFNLAGVSNIGLFHIPIEEMLFFVVIPQSCLFIWVFVRREQAWRRFVHDIMHHYRKWRA